MAYTFFATVSRMKYIDRWALMRNSRQENLSEHSLEVAMIAHALCVIGNTRYGRFLDADRAAVIALYHDASEIITGDMPTPVKYANTAIRDAYKAVEYSAEKALLERLPEDLRESFSPILCPDTEKEAESSQQEETATGKETEGSAREGCTESERYVRRLVKAADKLSALIKCIEERQSGNQEFSSAEESTRRTLAQMAQELPEVGDFLRDFMPAYGKTLDELTSQPGRDQRVPLSEEGTDRR